MRSAVPTLVHTWLVLDFFGASRRTGQPGSTLTTTIFGQSFLALVIAALLYPEYAPVPFAAANLSLSTLMIGMGLLGDTGRAARRRADNLLVGTSPLGPGTLVLARSLHGGFYVCLTTLGMALPPAILLYWVAGQSLWVVPAYLGLACVASSIAAGALSVTTHLAHQLLGPARAPLLAGTLRAVLLGAGFVGFALCLPHLDETRADLPLGDLALVWPPYWAARVLGGSSLESVYPYLLLLLGSGLALVCAAWFTEPLQSRNRAHRPRGGPLSRLNRKLAGTGPLGGAAAFVSAMLYRSPGFRLRTLPLFGLPLAMVGLAFGGGDDSQRRILLGMALQFPAIYLPFLVAFLPRADQPGAAWIFESSPTERVTLAREASLLALTTHLLFPVQGLALLALPIAGQGWIPSAALTSFSLGLGIMVAALGLHRLEEMPFTQEEDDAPGDFGAPVGMAMVLALVGAGFSQIADSLLGLGLGLAILVLGGRRLVTGRRRGR